MSNAPKRSIFENISRAISSIADMLCSSASAVSTTAEACDVVADTGLVMATNVQETAVIQSVGKKEKRLEILYEEFPSLKGKTVAELRH